MRRPASELTGHGDERSVRRWLGRGVRALCNAALVVGLMALVPIAIVAVRGDRFARILDRGSTGIAERVAFAERMRPFAVESNVSTTPREAGLVLNALVRPGAQVAGFVPIEPGERPAFVWRTTPLNVEMFGTAGPDIFNAPFYRTVLEAAARGLSERELRYLRAVATAPVWREFDFVARTPAVDVLGGSFNIPFGAGVTAEQRPMPRLGDARELAYVAVSRAAWHMAIGQRDSAEAVLRSIVSFGFVLIDNGPDVLHELVGTTIVGMGRDALQRYYVIQQDPRATSPALQSPDWSRSGGGSQPSADEVRRRMIARLDDPRVPRGERFEIVRSLSMGSCTNVRDVVLGPRAEVVEAIERARRSLPRYASERALMGLQTLPLDLPRGQMARGPFQTLAVSAASVPGALLGNPRLESCTRVLTSW